MQLWYFFRTFCVHFKTFACNLQFFAGKVLVQLNLTLVGKSDMYSDIYLRAVFRLNNNHYVLKALQRAGLLDLVQLSEPDCEESYLDMIRDHKRTYSQRWVKRFHPSSCHRPQNNNNQEKVTNIFSQPAGTRTGRCTQILRN